jgi:hypothetical protein
MQYEFGSILKSLSKKTAAWGALVQLGYAAALGSALDTGD